MKLTAQVFVTNSLNIHRTVWCIWQACLESWYFRCNFGIKRRRLRLLVLNNCCVYLHFCTHRCFTEEFCYWIIACIQEICAGVVKRNFTLRNEIIEFLVNTQYTMLCIDGALYVMEILVFGYEPLNT